MGLVRLGKVGLSYGRLREVRLVWLEVGLFKLVRLGKVMLG
jgi:hypothetical protein